MLKQRRVSTGLSTLGSRFPRVFLNKLASVPNTECAKFLGSSAFFGLLRLVPLYHCAFVGLTFFLAGFSWKQIFFS